MGVVLLILFLAVIGLISLAWGNDIPDVPIIPTIMLAVIVVICFIQMADAFTKMGIL